MNELEQKHNFNKEKSLKIIKNHMNELIKNNDNKEYLKDCRNFIPEIYYIYFDNTQCLLCGEKFINGNYLKIHLNKILHIFIELLNLPITCCICGKVLSVNKRAFFGFKRQIYVVSKYCNKCLNRTSFMKNYITKINLQKYNVEYPMQTFEIYQKSINNSTKIKKYKGIIYQAKYELDFLKYCEELNILDKVKKPPSFTYKGKDNKIHVYYPDFQINNTIIEIKSWYWLNKWKNKEERINAVRNKGYNFLLIADKNYNQFNKLFL